MIVLALPLARCATGEEPPADDGGSAGRAGSSGRGGSGGSASGSGGRIAQGGMPIFGGGPSSGSGGKSTAGAAGTTDGGTAGLSGGGTAGTASGSGGGAGTGGSLGMEGAACKAGTQCASGQCVSLKCAPDHCSDMDVTEDETDVDCGGSCKGCALGQACTVPTDCEGRNCAVDGTCGEPNHCVYGWDDAAEPCGATCRSATQSDQAACADVLQCYIENDCGPTDCGGQIQTPCGGNVLGKGNAAYTIADAVYACMCM